jgi:signal transduction histidine kinase
MNLAQEVSKASCDLQPRRRTKEPQRAKAPLDLERKRLYSLLDGLPACVSVSTPDYYVHFANRACRDFFGDIEGKRCFEAVHGRENPCLDCPLAEVLETRTPHWKEITSGKNSHTFQVYSYLFAEGDGPPQIMTFGIDITGRTQVEAHLRECEEKLRLPASQLITAQERERTRIAQELHDDLGQSLLTLNLQLGSLARKFPPELIGLQEDFSQCRNYLKHIIKKVRRLSHGLSPLGLELGLRAALIDLLEEFNSQHGIQCFLKVDEISGLFPKEAEINLYRILQEALSNISKYSQATQVDVSLTKADHQLHFCVEDNGKGFEVAKIMARRGRRKGLGLASMEERTRLMGGTFSISSKAQSGTKIHITVPLPQ